MDAAPFEIGVPPFAGSVRYIAITCSLSSKLMLSMPMLKLTSREVCQLKEEGTASSVSALLVLAISTELSFLQAANKAIEPNNNVRILNSYCV